MINIDYINGGKGCSWDLDELDSYSFFPHKSSLANIPLHLTNTHSSFSSLNLQGETHSFDFELCERGVESGRNMLGLDLNPCDLICPAEELGGERVTTMERVRALGVAGAHGVVLDPEGVHDVRKTYEIPNSMEEVVEGPEAMENCLEEPKSVGVGPERQSVAMDGVGELGFVGGDLGESKIVVGDLKGPKTVGADAEESEIMADGVAGSMAVGSGSGESETWRRAS